MKPFLSILALLFIISCSSSTNKIAKSGTNSDTIQVPKDSSVLYFKLKKDWKDSVPDALAAFVNKWYSEMLFALHEPVLSNYNGDKEIYRFTWLRTFHHPVAIRIEKQNDAIKLFTKVCNGAGGYRPGKLIFDSSFDIESDIFNLLVKKVDENKFWQMETEIPNGGMDGAEWILEVVRNNKYHIVTRWSPTIEKKQKNFGNIGRYFISISRIKKEEKKHIY